MIAADRASPMTPFRNGWISFGLPGVRPCDATLDQVHPRSVGRGEVEVEPLVPQQPLVHGRGLVGGQVVEHDVDFEAGGDLAVDLVQEHEELRLPDALGSTVAKRMRAAHHIADPLQAHAEPETLARELDRSHPGAAASLREGLAETLTITRLGLPPTLARILRSTNTIESMIEICRDHAANVKRWQDGQMVLRWVAAGMGEAAKQFRRVNGFLHLAALRAELERTVADRRHRCHNRRLQHPGRCLINSRGSTELGTSSDVVRRERWPQSRPQAAPQLGGGRRFASWRAG
jgi:hypothetical protein